MPVAAFPLVGDQLGSLFSGIATLAVVAFGVGLPILGS